MTESRLLPCRPLAPGLTGHMYWVGLRLEAIAAQQQAELEARQREAELAGGPREFARRGGSAPPGPEGATASSADSPGTRGGDQGGEAVAGLHGAGALVDALAPTAAELKTAKVAALDVPAADAKN